MSEEKKEKVIEIKFDSSKEKIFIIVRPSTTMEVYQKLLELCELGNKNNIFLLPSEFIESVKVIRDVKE